MQRSFVRRAKLVAAVTLAVVTWAGIAGARAETLVRLGAPVGTIPGIKTAIDEGLFQRDGLKVEIVTLSGGPNILTATVGGAIDIGYSDMFAWVGALQNGFALELIQPAVLRNKTDYMIAGPKSGVKTPADLRGKKIGVAAHVQAKLRLALYLEKFGLTIADVRPITMNQRDTIGAALSTGQIDAAIAPDPDVALWQQQYGVYILDGRPWLQIPERTATAGFFVTNAWLAAHRDIAIAFVRDARQGAHDFNVMAPAGKAAIIKKFDKIDFAAMEKESPGITERLKDDIGSDEGPIHPEALATWIKMAEDHGFLKNPGDYKVHISDLSILPPS